MTLDLRPLGAMLVTAIALGLTIVGIANADVLTAESTPALGIGAQEGTDVMKVDGGEVKCTSRDYEGTVHSSPSSQVRGKAKSKGCTFAGLAATVNMNECEYVTNFNATAGNTTLTQDVACPSGKEITITAPSVGTAKCIIHVPPQTGLGPGSAANAGAGTTREVTVSLNITNIKYSQTAGTAETGNCATADSTTGGTYTGSILFTAKNLAETSHIGIFLS